jgi:hypothetical protein
MKGTGDVKKRAGEQGRKPESPLSHAIDLDLKVTLPDGRGVRG